MNLNTDKETIWATQKPTLSILEIVQQEMKKYREKLALENKSKIDK